MYFLYEFPDLPDYSSDDNVFVRNSYKIHSSNYNYSIIEQIKNEKVFKTEKVNSQIIGKIKCNVKSEDVTVQWLKNNDIINTMIDDDQDKIKKYEVIEKGKERMLIVNDINTNDEGEYICQSGKFRSAFYLLIDSETTAKEIKNGDIFESKSNENELYFQDDKSLSSTSSSSKRRNNIIGIKDVYVKDGSKNVELMCRVKNKYSKVEWFKDNKKIINNGRYEILSDEHERILKINKPKLEDNGNYICKNGQHKVILNLIVNNSINFNVVNEGEDLLGALPSDEDNFFFTNSISNNPTKSINYKSEEKELVYYENQNANLTCYLKNQNDSVLWFKGDNSIVNTEKYYIMKDGPIRTLVINNLNNNDSGSYLCKNQLNLLQYIEFNIKIKGMHKNINITNYYHFG
jgi:hypothetical protein